MSRDFRRLHVFRMADELVIAVYRATAAFPAEERYGLQAQIRRAAVSVVANIVEGCQRSGTKDYLRFISISLGSAAETRYLLELAARLGYVKDLDSVALDAGYGRLVRSLDRLLGSLREPLGVRQCP